MRSPDPPEDPPEVDTVVVESTYGDRRHPLPDPHVLADAVCRTIERGGNAWPAAGRG